MTENHIGRGRVSDGHICKFPLNQLRQCPIWSRSNPQIVMSLTFHILLVMVNLWVDFISCNVHHNVDFSQQ